MPIVFVMFNGAARRMIGVAIGICIASLALRYAYFAIWPGLEKTLFVYRHSETRADSIAFGVLLACVCQTVRGRRLVGILVTRPFVIAAALILLATYAFHDAYFQNTIRFTIQSLALLPLVAGTVFGQPFPMVNVALNAVPIRWIGRLSYSLYIWHGSAYFLLGEWAPKQPAAAMVAVLMFTFLLAMASYYGIERPASRLRGRFHARRATNRTLTDAIAVARPSNIHT